jgi:hypothetical protein
VLCLVTRTVLGNRLAGILHSCVIRHTAYSETIAWAHSTNPPNYPGRLTPCSRV